MNRIFTIAAFLFITLTAGAQEVLVKVQYKENTTYKQTNKTATDINITYPGGEPMAQSQENNVISTTTTGKAAADKVIPFTVKIDMGAEQAAQLGNVSLKGSIKPGQAPVIETIDAPQMDENTKEMLKKMLDGTMKQAIMPETKVKVGGTFKQEIPMEIPMGPMTFNLKSTTTYKLVKVEGDNAYFDTDTVITMDGSVDGQNMTASGKGTGKCVYNSKNNFIAKNDMTVNMAMVMEMQGMKMDLTTKTTTSQNTEITANK